MEKYWIKKLRNNPSAVVKMMRMIREDVHSVFLNWEYPALGQALSKLLYLKEQ